MSFRQKRETWGAGPRTHNESPLPKPKSLPRSRQWRHWLMLAPVMRDRSVAVSACCAKILCGCILSASFSAGTLTIDRVCFQSRIILNTISSGWKQKQSVLRSATCICCSCHSLEALSGEPTSQNTTLRESC